MAIRMCNMNGLVATAAMALLLMPLQYYVGFREPEPALPPPPAPPAWFERALSQIPPLELFGTAALLLLAFITYAFEWVQRKIIEKRILKLNQYLAARVEHLRAWDARQENLESSLRLVQSATAEYTLLLYLILRHQRRVPAVCPPSNYSVVFENK